MVGDDEGRVISYKKGTWSQPKKIDPSGAPLSAISCTGDTSCVAVDWSGNVLTFNGASWSSPVAVYPHGGGLYSVSCVLGSSEFCVAGGGTSEVSGESGPSVDKEGGLFTYQKGKWTKVALSVKAEVTGVSCASASFCVAVDHGGAVATYDGKKWSSNGLDYASDKTGFSAVSCPKVGFCLATTGAGTLEEYENAKWYGLTESTNDGAGDYAIGCVPGSYACTIVDDDGYAMSYNGKTWTSPTMIDTGQKSAANNPALTSVSCPRTSFCVATDYFGNVLIAKD